MTNPRPEHVLKSKIPHKSSLRRICLPREIFWRKQHSEHQTLSSAQYKNRARGQKSRVYHVNIPKSMSTFLLEDCFWRHSFSGQIFFTIFRWIVRQARESALDETANLAGNALLLQFSCHTSFIRLFLRAAAVFFEQAIFSIKATSTLSILRGRCKCFHF